MMTRELSPDAAALLRSGRTAFRPDVSDRGRVLESLTRSLGESAFVDEPPDGKIVHDTTGARWSWRAAKVIGGFAALAVGAGAWVASSSWKATPSQVRAVAVAPSAPVQALPPSPAMAAASSDHAPPAESPRAADRVASPARSASRSAARPAADSLSEEVRLLSSAERQLSDGHGEDALKTLAEHERRFPKGALAEQRLAARVEALCALGRFADAKTDLTRLAREYPKSPHLDGARRFCGTGLGSDL